MILFTIGILIAIIIKRGIQNNLKGGEQGYVRKITLRIE